MKKIVPILIIGILVISGLGAAVNIEKQQHLDEFKEITFHQPNIIEKNRYTNIEITETTQTWETNKPQVPVYIKQYVFPFGTQINNIQVTFSETTTKKIDKPIQPAPESYLTSLDIKQNRETQPKNLNYDDITIYPKERFNYKIGSGLENNEHVLYLTLYLYPVQYYPQDQTITIAHDATIQFNYKLPTQPQIFKDDYDLLILTPEEFNEELQPLVEHKNDIGIATKLVTVEEIPQQGVDLPEDIKYYIKDAIETWGITYVLLVGSGTEENEKFPVRYAYLPDLPNEEYFPTVLYYADIYNATGNFSNWDFDGDQKYAEFPTDMPNMDMYPDVCLGILPCNNEEEVTNVVNKIIDYKEHNKMTGKILQVGGDTFTWDSDHINEGEISNEAVLTKLPGYETRRLWASEGKITKLNIALGFKGNVDFVDFSGHGSPIAWGTHPPQDEETWVPPKALISPYLYFLYIDFDIFMVNNARKLPVVVFNACSNNKFTEVEQCMGWKTVGKTNGGGIAAFAASGLGFGLGGLNETERRWGWMEVNIFDQLYNNKILGQTWKNVIAGYVSNFSSLDWERIDSKTVVAMTLIGDPTLVIEDGDNPREVPKIMQLIISLLERLSDTFLLVDTES